MSDQLSIAHIAQLHEIQRARNKRKQGGLGPVIEELIRGLNDHGVTLIDGNLKAAREAQAKRYWDSGVAKALGYRNPKTYLEDVPEAPSIDLDNVSLEHPWLLLIEPRIGFDKLRASAGIAWCQDWVEKRDGDAPKDGKPFWVAFNDGRRRRGRKIDPRFDVSGSFDNHGFTAFIAACAVLQKRDIVGEGIGDTYDPYYMHLTGSFDAGGQGGYANLITAPDGSPQIRDGYLSHSDGCGAYGIPSYVRY